jgi:hypothetical protein
MITARINTIANITGRYLLKTSKNEFNSKLISKIRHLVDESRLEIIAVSILIIINEIKLTGAGLIFSSLKNFRMEGINIKSIREIPVNTRIIIRANNSEFNRV